MQCTSMHSESRASGNTHWPYPEAAHVWVPLGGNVPGARQCCKALLFLKLGGCIRPGHTGTMLEDWPGATSHSHANTVHYSQQS
jgi:hypothetical protein